MGTETTAPSRRERARAATIEEIKETALGLMRDRGTTDVTFADIARSMGMTAPALYRYFDDRDALLEALIADAYDEVGREVAAGRDAVPTEDLGGRFLAASQGYRRWARREPQKFALIFGLPVPGFTAPPEGPTTEAARRAMAQLSALFLDAQARGELGSPIVPEASPALAAGLAAKRDEMADAMPAATFQAMLHAWAALHGFACLEAYGHLDWLDEAARDALFVTLTQATATASGLPVPST